MKKQIGWLAFVSALTMTTAAQAEPEYFYEGKLHFPVLGLEFRDRSSYPNDQAGEGYQANAKNSVLEKCEKIRAALANDQAFKSLSCSDLEEIKAKPDYSQFQAQAVLELDENLMQKVSAGEVSGGLVRASNFSNRRHQWQASRESARKKYDRACREQQRKISRRYKNSYVFFDCGLTQEKGGSAGWHYHSKSIAYIVPNEESIPRCENGKGEDESWWEEIGTIVSRPHECEFGGVRTDHFKMMKQILCDNGEISETGETKEGEFRGSTGECHKGADCPNRVHGEKWDHVNPLHPLMVREKCEFGGDLFQVFVRVEKKKCHNGQEQVESSEAGDFLRTEGRCHDPLPCGLRDHGESWWVKTGTVEKPGFCRHGGDLVDILEELSLSICENGEVKNTGQTRLGNFIETRGSCRSN